MSIFHLSSIGSVTKCKIMSEGHSMIQSPTINDYDIVWLWFLVLIEKLVKHYRKT